MEGHMKTLYWAFWKTPFAFLTSLIFSLATGAWVIFAILGIFPCILQLIAGAVRYALDKGIDHMEATMTPPKVQPKSKIILRSY